ncbi:MAG: methyltransferase domain-containing protein [Pseudomonadota bacterium]
MKHDSVKNYYGQKLQSSADLQTNACCSPETVPDRLKRVLGLIHEDVASKYYGCGLIAPEVLQGARILDLGSGSGRDVFVLSALAGESGHVDGVDMTEEQLSVARAHVETHRDRFGYIKANTAFHHGYIEDLAALGLAPESYDVIVSNCVINLALDKAAVLKGAWDLLAPGGEMYFSDVYASRRVPDDLRADPVLYGECLSGAMYHGDFRSVARRTGFIDPRVVEARPLTIENPALQAKLGEIRFHSVTYRLFKLLGLEDSQEDYGQAVVYRGTVDGSEDVFVLDRETRFERGRATTVSGNTAQMVLRTRFAPHFDVIGKGVVHFGAFNAFDAPITDAADPSTCC